MGGRRLTAILAADIAGYSALMGASDVETVADLKGHQSAVLPLITGYSGRVIDTAGDGILAEFSSVFNAVKCAIAIQEVMSERNASVAPERRMQFRIGINQGDVLFDKDRIYGDGINVAARLEGICQPGGICISGKVYDEIKGRFEIQYDDIGEQSLKNISQPVRAYRITVSGSSSKANEGRVSWRPSRWAVAAALLALAVMGAGVAVWSTRDLTAVLPGGLQAQLTAALQNSIPKMPIDRRQRMIDAFVKGKAHRAMAVAREAQRAWWTHGWSSREAAEEKALERCQQYFDELCGLVVTDDVVARLGVDGNLTVRDAPRVRYNGVFNPERIPAIDKNVEQRMDVVGYLTAASPKASAFHAAGILHVVTAAPTQRAAEEQALRACNDDPARNRAGGGPCYLYSVDNRVVLPLRATGAITTAPSARGTESSIRDTLLSVIAKIAPAYANRNEQVRQYVESNEHKALAAHPPSGSWRLRGQESASIAEERVLEACQARHGGPCVLVAVNDDVRASATETNLTRRPMRRVMFEGLFEPDQIPAATQVLRQRADVVGYRAAPGYKAAAFHPWGRLFIVAGATSQHAAEEQALAACNRDPDRDGKDGACLLYSTDNQVVLPKRLSAPLTAQ